jgi:hypothetical protein
MYHQPQMVVYSLVELRFRQRLQLSTLAISFVHLPLAKFELRAEILAISG